MKLMRILAVTALVLGFFASSATTQSNSSYESARRILGIDFINPYDVAIGCGILYTRDQLKHFEETLPSENILRWAKKNRYVVIAGPPAPMNLLNIYSLKPEFFFSLSWYEKEALSDNDKVTTNWLIIRKEPVPNSTYKNWDEQLQLLSDDERVPNASEMSWFITTFYEVRSIRLFEQAYVRTSSVASRYIHVTVGYLDWDKIFVSIWWDDDYHDSIDLASSRLPH